MAGYEREDKERILRSFPDADYMIGAIDCTAEQKEQIREKMRLWYEHRWRYHYAVMELPFIAMGRAVHRSRHFTCSSFAAKFLSDAGITSFAKDESLVTPKDFYEWDGYTCIFRGKLRELVEEEPVRERAMLLQERRQCMKDRKKIFEAVFLSRSRCWRSRFSSGDRTGPIFFY